MKAQITRKKINWPKLFLVNWVRASTSNSLQYLIWSKSNTVKIYSVVESVKLILVLSIFDLLTTPQGHQFDSMMNILPVLLVIPVDLICHMAMFEKKSWPPGHPQRPKVPPLGHDQGDRKKIPSDMFCIFHLYNKHDVWYKNLWNRHNNRNLMIFDLLTSPKGHQFDPRMKFYLHSVLFVIPVDLICHMTMLEKTIFDPLSTPSTPKSEP